MAATKLAEDVHAEAPGPSQQLMVAQQEAHALELTEQDGGPAGICFIRSFRRFSAHSVGFPLIP